MKLVCNGLDLSDACLKVSKAIGVKKTNPILECIKLTAKDDILTLLATDKELTIEKSIKADVLMEGEVVVPGKYFVELIKKLENEQIELSCLEEGLLTIRYFDSETKLQTFSVEEYPLIDKNIDEKSFSISQKDFKELINRAVFACATDDSRPVLKGCLLEVEFNNVYAVALDGFRLSYSRKENTDTTGNFKAIIPSRTLNEILRLLDKDEDILTIVFKENNLMVKIGDTTLISVLLEGDFIAYKQIIPTNFLTEIKINRQMLLSSIDRASVFSRSDKMNLVKLDIKERFLNILSDSEVGNLNESIAIEMEGKDVNIAFNSKYITEFLRTIDDEFIKIYFNSSIAPCVIKPLEGDEYLYLILPVRING